MVAFQTTMLPQARLAGHCSDAHTCKPLVACTLLFAPVVRQVWTGHMHMPACSCDRLCCACAGFGKHLGVAGRRSPMPPAHAAPEQQVSSKEGALLLSLPRSQHGRLQDSAGCHNEGCVLEDRSACISACRPDPSVCRMRTLWTGRQRGNVRLGHSQASLPFRRRLQVPSRRRQLQRRRGEHDRPDLPHQHRHSLCARPHHPLKPQVS